MSADLLSARKPLGFIPSASPNDMPRTPKTIAEDLDQPPKQPTLNELDPTLSFICRDLIGLANDSPTVLALRENAC